MAVLIEGVCLLLRCDAVERLYPGGVKALASSCTAEAVCADEELMSLTFDDSDAAEDYLAELEQYGFRHLVHDLAIDAVLADPHLGPISPCGWADYGQVTIESDPNKRVAVCSMPGAEVSDLCVPRGWRFKGSRSEALALAQDDDDDDGDSEDADDSDDDSPKV
ncbi:MAG TPA: hypothetical protein VFN67_16315 [Polyangiales bacterium]|nr:hypothetical protein [Polyangiales bacterium]